MVDNAYIGFPEAVSFICFNDFNDERISAFSMASPSRTEKDAPNQVDIATRSFINVVLEGKIELLGTLDGGNGSFEPVPKSVLLRDDYYIDLQKNELCFHRPPMRYWGLSPNEARALEMERLEEISKTPNWVKLRIPTSVLRKIAVALRGKKSKARPPTKVQLLAEQMLALEKLPVSAGKSLQKIYKGDPKTLRAAIKLANKIRDEGK